MKKLKGYLDTYKEAKILDIATGQGTFMSMIASIYDDYCEMTGIDTSQRALEAIAGNFADPRISAKKMDVNDMSFKNGYFDITCLSNSMHHMKDIDEVISKMAVVTNDNGILVFNEMKSDNDSEKKMTHTLLHHFWAEIDELNGIVHRKTMTKNEITDIFERHPEVKLIDFWELESDEKQEIDKSAYEWLAKTIESSLKRVQNSNDFRKFSKEADLLKRRLSEIGFESASQVIVIAEKNK